MAENLNPHIKPLPVDPKTGMPPGYQKLTDLYKKYSSLPENKLRLMEEGNTPVDLAMPTFEDRRKQLQALPIDPKTGMPQGYKKLSEAFVPEQSQEYPPGGFVETAVQEKPDTSRIPDYLKRIETPMNIFGTVPKGVPNPLIPGIPEEISTKWDPYKDRAWVDVFDEAIKNFPKSSFQAVGDMANAFIHFKTTAKALGRLAAGATQAFIPGEQKYEKDVRAVFDFFKSRYGSLPEFKRAVAKDPAGILLDASMALQPAARGLKTVGEAWNIPKVTKTAETLQKIERATNPIEAARKGLNLTKRFGAMVTIPKKLPNMMYQKASKFAATIKPWIAEEITDLALKHDILPNINGFAKANDIIEKINSLIVDAIEKSTARNAQIPIDTLFKEFDKLAKEAVTLESRPTKTLKMLNKIKQEVIQENLARGNTTFSPIELQKRKQRIYRKLEKKYAETAYSDMRVKAEKSMARMAKESLEKLMPELKGLNARESELLRINETISEVAKTYGILNQLKRGDIFQHLVALYSMAPVKSRLAMALNRLRQKGRIIPDDSFLVKLVESPTLQTGGFQAGRGTRVLKEEYPREYIEEE